MQPKILSFLLRIQWFIRMSEAPVGYLEFVTHPFVATSDKIKEKGFKPKFTTRDALQSRLR